MSTSRRVAVSAVARAMTDVAKAIPAGCAEQLPTSVPRGEHDHRAAGFRRGARWAIEAILDRLGGPETAKTRELRDFLERARTFRLSE